MQTAQSNLYSRHLFEDSPSSSLQRPSYSQRQQEQRYLLQTQLEQELLQHQIHQRYLESQHRYSLQQQHPQHRNDYEQLHSSNAPLSHKYQPYFQSHARNNRMLSSSIENRTNLNNNNNSVRHILNKQINYNFNNVSNYYNSSKITEPLPLPSASSHLTKATIKPTKSIDYNSCNNNNTINKTKPYQSNNNNNNSSINNNDTYIEYLQKPIKMQREEIIIEHSQLVLNGNEQTNGTNAGHRTNHYTQVRLSIVIFAHFQ